jgi:hypothetical protein
VKLSCFEKLFGKTASPTTSCMDERESARITYFFSFIPTNVSMSGGEITSSRIKLF